MAQPNVIMCFHFTAAYIIFVVERINPIPKNGIKNFTNSLPGISRESNDSIIVGKYSI